MSTTKKIFTRLSQKHDLEINWLKAENFVPLQGELIIYDIEVDSAGNTLTDSDGLSMLPNGRTKPYTYERFKIGDGIKTVTDLPFASDKDHTHPIASGKALVQEPLSLVGITTVETSDGENGWEITSNTLSATFNPLFSNGAIFHIDFQGNVNLEIDANAFEDAGLNPAEAGYVEIDGIKLTAENVSAFGCKYRYSGDITREITVKARYARYEFATFTKNVLVHSADGFMSGEQAEKLDNIYIDSDNNNTGFGNIDTLEFNASNGFGTGTNNIIGSKAFNILNMDATNHTFTLDSVEGLEVGDIFTIKFKTNYNDMAKITAINENIITTSALSKEELSNLPNPNGRTFDDIWTDSLVLENGEVVFGTEVNSLRINTKPQCGTKFFGTDSFVEGCCNIATGDCAHAEGYNTQALGRYAHAEGLSTIAYYGAHSEGKDTKAIGDMAHAEGYNSKAVNLASHAEGCDTLSSGGQAHAEGWMSKATGPMAHAEGQKTEATGLGAHAEGDSTVAGGNAAHAEGYNTQALGGCSHAEGWGTIANAGVNAQHVQGRWNEPLPAPYVHIVGHGTSDTNRKNIHTLDWNGNAWYEGNININGLYIDTSGEAIPGQKIGSLTNLSSLTSGKIDINYFIDDVAFEPDTIYNKKTNAKYFGYLDVDNSNNILSDGMYLLVYDMEILSSPNPESIGISGQNTNLSNKRVGGTTYINSKFTTEKYNHIYYPFAVDNSTYKKYGVYYTDKSANGVTNECSYKIHNIRLYKLNELTTNINSFKIGRDDNGNIITTLNDSTKRNILLDIDVTPSMAIYNDGTKNLIALLDAVSVDNTVIYTSSISEINNIKNIGVMAGYSEETHAISYLDLPITINGEKIKYPNRQDLCQENSNIFIECEGYAEFHFRDTTLNKGAHTEFYIDDILLKPYETIPWVGIESDEVHEDRKYRFKGNINSGIVIKTFLNPNFYFYDFFKRTYTKGLISGIDKEKLDNLNIEELATKDEVDEKLQQHTHQLAGYGELIPLDLRNITILGDGSYPDSTIDARSLYGANGYYIINYTGYIELSVSSHCDDSNGNGVGASIDIFNENNPVSGFSWNSSNSKEVFNYKGKADKIEVYTAWSSVDFIKFNGTSNIVAQDGFMSAEDKEKLDNVYTKEETDEKLENKSNKQTVTAHTKNLKNPHNVTAEQVGAYTKDDIDFKLELFHSQLFHKIYHNEIDSSYGLITDVLYLYNAENAQIGETYDKVPFRTATIFNKQPSAMYIGLPPIIQTAIADDGLVYVRMISFKDGAEDEYDFTVPWECKTYTKEEVDNKIGSIDTALDEILKIQNVLIGGAN